ncbi:MAG: hydrolase [Thiofilum sp.]|uniref:hydrolase n=1 Tax=Thiofilum sp. TaxID=2212733 RepID=UPI0025FDD006|nr:hydrolase [Thiofilum sp.]MBK8454700.1 hydrolase [Thiofilum sp.]
MSQTFKPAWWLRSPHLQTIWPVFMRHRPTLPLVVEAVTLSDGDSIQLQRYGRPNSPYILVIHGLEGSLESHYAKPTLKALYEAGFSPIFMQLRGSAGIPNHKPYSYHSGRTQDVAEVLDYLAATQRTVVGLVGFSLGGNLTLKYMGEVGVNTTIRAAVAISIPFQLAACAQRLEQGFSKLYGRHLLNDLKNSYRRKFHNRPKPLAVNLEQITTLYQFDDQVTAPLNGFKDAADYYAKSSSAAFLKAIHYPTLIIHAKDDPFMTPAIVPTASEISAAVTLAISEHGGHVGFVQGQWPWQAHYWLDQRISQWLSQQLHPIT